jgi:cytochrome P450
MAVVDLREPTFIEDPFPLIERLRMDGPVHRSTLGALLLLRHADSDFVLRDPRFSRNIGRWPPYQTFRPFGAGSALERTSEELLFNLDPPAHTRIRRLVSRAFTPRAVARMDATIRSVAADLLAAATPGEPFDVMAGFARPFPVRVILGILGLPSADFADLKRWSEAAALIAEPAAPRAAYVQASTAVEQMRGYLTAAVAARRRRPPGEDMLGILVSTDEAGEALTDDEVVSSLIAMFVAGHETTTNLIGNAVWVFARNPAVWERLRAEPSLTATAVEECCGTSRRSTSLSAYRSRTSRSAGCPSPPVRSSCP